MKTLIVGASGSTEKLLVEQLINAGKEVKIIVRPTSNYSESWLQNGKLVLRRGIF